MTKPKIIAHCTVRNEENWIWYSLQSTLSFMDKITVADTGSADSTLQIIKSLSDPKISLQEFPKTVDETALSQVRQHLLLQTKSADWLMILDGDEVWPQSSLSAVVEFIRLQGEHYDSIVVPTYNCVGDVFHISPPSQGHYAIAGRVGHYNLRFINLKRVSGLHVANPPGQLQSYLDDHDIPVQNRDVNRIAFLNTPYFHLTHLPRTSNRKNETAVFWRAAKRKFSLGQSLSPDQEFPLVFYLPHPHIVPSPWKRRSLKYLLIALLVWPLRHLKNLVHA